MGIMVLANLPFFNHENGSFGMVGMVIVDDNFGVGVTVGVVVVVVIVVEIVIVAVAIAVELYGI